MLITYEVPADAKRMTAGVQGESNVREFLFDITAWRTVTSGAGTAEMIVQRNGDSSPYAAVVTMKDENTVSWVVTAADTAKAGVGHIELRWSNDGQIVKSRILDMKIDPALDYQLPDDSLDPWASWMPDIINAAAAIQDFPGSVADAVGDWLEEHLEPTEPPVDDTLSVEGAAADAKKTGDEIGNVTNALSTNLEYYHPERIDFLGDDYFTQTVEGVTVEYLGANKFRFSGTNTYSGALLFVVNPLHRGFHTQNTIENYTDGHITFESNAVYCVQTKVDGTILDGEGNAWYPSISIYVKGASSTTGVRDTNNYHDVRVGTTFNSNTDVNIVFYISAGVRYDCTITLVLYKTKELINDYELMQQKMQEFNNNVEIISKDNYRYSGSNIGILSSDTDVLINSTQPFSSTLYITNHKAFNPSSNVSHLIQLVPGQKYRLTAYRMSDYTKDTDYAVENNWPIFLSVYIEGGSSTISEVVHIDERKLVVGFTAPTVPVAIAVYIRGGVRYTSFLVHLEASIVPAGESEPVQPYYMPELSDTIEKVRNEMTEPCLVFPLVTDIHIRSAGYPKTYNKMIANMDYFCNEIHCNALVNLGDAVDGTNAKATTLTDAFEITKLFKNLKSKYLFVSGNHDCNRYSSGSQIMSIQDVFRALYNSTDATAYNFAENGTDYYVDYPSVGVRVVALNSTNNKYQTYAYGDTTNNWLQSALDTDCHVFVITHVSCVPLHVWNNNECRNYSAIQDTLYAFASSGKQLVILTGHSHLDAVFIDPFNEVTFASQKLDAPFDITSGGYEKMRGSVDGYDTTSQEAGTYTEDCWTVCVYKPMTKDLSMIRFGAGHDRYLHTEPRGAGTLTSRFSSVGSWASSDEQVATVSDGVVTAVSSGRCAVVARETTTGNEEIWIIDSI